MYDLMDRPDDLMDRPGRCARLDHLTRLYATAFFSHIGSVLGFAVRVLYVGRNGNEIHVLLSDRAWGRYVRWQTRPESGAASAAAALKAVDDMRSRGDFRIAVWKAANRLQFEAIASEKRAALSPFTAHSSVSRVTLH